MKVIKENITSTIIINKSTFITELIKVNSIDEIKEELLNVKTKYKDATHYCYAYILDDNKKSSDDGEPGGTAGVPMMEVLNKHELNKILCIVTRYFGGIKLGAGGLVRAYRKSVVETLEKATFNELIDGYNLIVEVPYNKQSEIEYILKTNYTKKFNETVIYEIECDKETANIIETKFKIIKKDEKKIEK